MERSGSLRIGIGAQILGKGKGGVETCVAALIRALAEIESPHHYFLYASAQPPEFLRRLPANFHLRTLPSGSPWIERPLWTPLAYRRDRLDTILLQRALPPWGCPRAVLHLHDAMYATHAELFSGWKRRLLVRLFRGGVRRAACVVTPSEAARAEIVAHYGAPADRVFVVPNAVDPREFRALAARTETGGEAASERFGLRRPYVLYLGAVERNKNIHLLVDAFAQFAAAHPGYDLAIVGKWRGETHAGYRDELAARASAAGVGDRVKFTGYVSADDRRDLLANAAMLAFPSAAEGFGLPPLEAMACGVPVVAARIPAVEEVCGGAALLAEPNDARSLFEAMARLHADPELRRERIERGLARAGSFSWRRSAERLVEVFEFAARPAGRL